MTLTTSLTTTDASVALTPVLIVDDSRGQRHLLRRTLEKWGYDVVEAASGADALSLCEAAHFDVVISDWMMPGMSGVEFCRALRNNTSQPTYFILLTAQTESDVLAEGLESGADDFLSKPFQAVELRARLRAGERVIQAQQALATKNHALTSALDELSATYAAIERDLKGARRFQEGLLPDLHVDLGPADISLLFRSSGHVGGDLVGHFAVNDTEHVVYSVDVSGHGVASALMTARVAGYFSDVDPDRNIALAAVANGYRLRPLKDVFSHLNAILQSDDETDQYLTMALAHIDFATGAVEVCSAGHPSAVLQRQDGAVTFYELWSTPIGLLDEGEYATARLRLGSGDRFMLYSDGVTECPDPGGNLLDETGLKNLMLGMHSLTGIEYVASLLAGLTTFHQSEDFPDDISAAVIHWR